METIWCWDHDFEIVPTAELLRKTLGICFLQKFFVFYWEKIAMIQQQVLVPLPRRLLNYPLKVSLHILKSN